MRKYIIGGLIGFCLAFAASAHAEVTTMVNKIVEGSFPVKVEGQQLEQQAIVIEGTSYLPVRAIGDALGMDVKFDADLGIELTQKAQPTPSVDTTSPTPTPAPTMSKEQRIDQLKDYIKQNQIAIKADQMTIATNTSQSIIDECNRDISDRQAQNVEYQKELDTLTAQP